MTLSPTMSQEDMDTFLKSLGATDNPFTVQDLFDGRKNDGVWTRMQHHAADAKQGVRPRGFFLQTSTYRSRG